MTARPTVALIAAIDRHRAIGRGGGLLWHERDDQARFRAVTMGCPVIMGRKTWDSLPPKFQPLPGRRNVVLTRDVAWRAGGAESAPSLAAALALTAEATKVFVIGGGELYALALPRADELFLTEIDAEFGGADAHFPPFDKSAFTAVAREARATADGTGYAFVHYCRTP